MKLRRLLPIVFIVCVLSCRNSETNITGSSIPTQIPGGLDSAFSKMTRAATIQQDSLKPAFQAVASMFADTAISRKVALRWHQKFANYLSEKNAEAAIGRLNLAVGIALCGNYEFESGIKYYLVALENFTRARDYALVMRTYNSLSLAYHDFADFKKGKEYAKLAINTINDHPEISNKNLLWYSYNNLGINHDDDSMPTEAIKCHHQALAYAINASDSSYSFNNLGNSTKKLKQFDSAHSYFAKALELAKKDPGDTYHLASVYCNLFDMERLQKNYYEAVSLLDSAQNYVAKSESPEKKIDYYYYVYLLRSEMGDSASACRALNRYVELKNSLFSAEKARIVYGYQLKFETERKEKQIAEEQLKSKQKDIWLLVLGSSIAIVMLSFNKYKSRSKYKQEHLKLENQLLREQAILKVQEQRLEISKDLHDNIGARLTFISSVLENIKDSQHDKIDDHVSSKIITLTRFTENSIAELRNTLWVLNEEQVDLEALKEKILNFISDAAEAKNNIAFQVNFEIAENQLLETKLVVNIYRSIQEIVNNAIKYADAHTIKIELTHDSGYISIAISDDGVGFDHEKERSKSFGLKNIETRVKASGGTLLIITHPGKGTAYTMKIPSNNG